jgi:hypothetical protein
MRLTALLFDPHTRAPYRIANFIATAATARVVEDTIASTVAAGVRVAGTEIAIAATTAEIMLVVSLTLVTSPPPLIPTIN